MIPRTNTEIPIASPYYLMNVLLFRIVEHISTRRINLLVRNVNKHILTVKSVSGKKTKKKYRPVPIDTILPNAVVRPTPSWAEEVESELSRTYSSF